VAVRSWLVVGAVLLGCGSSSNTTPDNSSSSGGSIGGFNTGDGGPDDIDDSDCSDAAGLVYVVSADDDLYSFQPNQTRFTKVGRLTCPAASGATPNSMAIDRQGTAWVNYTDGTLFKVSTTTAKCEATTYVPGQQGFVKMGMAFSKGAKSKTETLYVVGLDNSDSKIGYGLGVIDLETFQLKKLGDFSDDLKGRGAELTGTGDGKLFGFFTTKPDASLAQVNLLSGATTNKTALTSVDTGESWAFSFWGGDFWFYTSPGKSTPSKVTRLARSKDDDISVLTDDVGGFRIVGAGVSTCAPITPPK
jgi:hypothetical protein